MPSFDDRLRRDLDSLGRPTDPGDAMERIAQRKRRLPRTRRIQAATMAVVVLAATSGAGYGLYRAFGVDKRPAVEITPVPVPSSQFQNGLIAFTSAEGGDYDIFVVQPDGSGLRRLTEYEGSDSAPAWSPDGDRIVYARDPVKTSIEGDIWIMNADGSRPRWVANAARRPSPTWSPDGGSIAFVTAGGLFRVSVEGGDPVRIFDAEAYDPEWSPDGGRIAFVTDDGIALIRPDGSDFRQITFAERDQGDDLDPSWSPDGRWLTFRRRMCRACHYEVFTMRADGSDLRRLTQDPFFDQGISWSPDGTKIIFNRVDQESDPESAFWTVDVDDRELSPVGFVAGNDPAWQPIPPAKGIEPVALPEPETAGLCVSSMAYGDFDGDGQLDEAKTVFDRPPPCEPTEQALQGQTLTVTLRTGESISTSCPACVALDDPDVNADGTTELLIQSAKRGDAFDVGFYVVEAGRLARVEIHPGIEGFPEGVASFPLEKGYPKGPDIRFHLRGLRCEDTEEGRQLVAFSSESESHLGPFDITETGFVLEGSVLRPLGRSEERAGTPDPQAVFRSTNAFEVCRGSVG